VKHSTPQFKDKNPLNTLKSSSYQTHLNILPSQQTISNGLDWNPFYDLLIKTLFPYLYLAKQQSMASAKLNETKSEHVPIINENLSISSAFHDPLSSSRNHQDLPLPVAQAPFSSALQMNPLILNYFSSIAQAVNPHFSSSSATFDSNVDFLNSKSSNELDDVDVDVDEEDAYKDAETMEKNEEECDQMEADEETNETLLRNCSSGRQSNDGSLYSSLNITTSSSSETVSSTASSSNKTPKSSNKIKNFSVDALLGVV
jgi:hypothetical protein